MGAAVPWNEGGAAVTTCPKCGSLEQSDREGVTRYSCRSFQSGDFPLMASSRCDGLAAAYRRGLVAGVELAKDFLNDDPNWTRVDAELARRIG